MNFDITNKSKSKNVTAETRSEDITPIPELEKVDETVFNILPTNSQATDLVATYHQTPNSGQDTSPTKSTTTHINPSKIPLMVTALLIGLIGLGGGAYALFHKLNISRPSEVYFGDVPGSGSECFDNPRNYMPSPYKYIEGATKSPNDADDWILWPIKDQCANPQKLAEIFGPLNKIIDNNDGNDNNDVYITKPLNQGGSHGFTFNHILSIQGYDTSVLMRGGYDDLTESKLNDLHYAGKDTQSIENCDINATQVVFDLTGRDETGKKVAKPNAAGWRARTGYWQLDLTPKFKCDGAYPNQQSLGAAFIRVVPLNNPTPTPSPSPTVSPTPTIRPIATPSPSPTPQLLNHTIQGNVTCTRNGQKIPVSNVKVRAYRTYQNNGQSAQDLKPILLTSAQGNFVFDFNNTVASDSYDIALLKADGNVMSPTITVPVSNINNASLGYIGETTVVGATLNGAKCNNDSEYSQSNPTFPANYRGNYAYCILTANVISGFDFNLGECSLAATSTPSPTPNPMLCLDLNTSKTSPQRGDTVIYTCNGSGDDAQYANFRLLRDGQTISPYGSYIALDANKRANWSLSLPIDMVQGSYKVQCQICTGDTSTSRCTNWSLAQ